MGHLWRVAMLGKLQAESERTVVPRFRTRRVGLLLAYLAFYRERSHSREELASLLWPELETEPARRNLRQALSSLRRHLEPPSVPRGAILVAKQGRVSLNPEYVASDAHEFEAAVRAGLAESSLPRKIETLERAVELYKGDLLPGYYEEWVYQERLRLEDLLVSALRQLVEACEVRGQVDEAIRYVRRALAKDYLQEDLHAALMRLYLASERPASAIQHFQDWKQKLAAELSEEPSVELQSLADQASRQGTSGGKKKTPATQPVERRDSAPGHEVALPVHRLPVQLTRFFGRSAVLDHAVAEIAERGARLVTIVGPAGAGKTRLSVEVGRTMGQEHGWNVWFVPLADTSDGAMLLDAVVGAIGVPRETSSSPLEILGARLAGPRNLLILDNLEHIVDGAIPPIQQILGGIRDVSLLVTTRHSLKLDGEREVDLAPLPIPDAESLEAGTPNDLADVPSVQLFVDRAQAVLPDFQVTPQNARAVAAVCAKLDGLPLAIEIAAGLSNAFTPAQLLQNLGNRLEVLRSRRRDLSDRHRTLRAAIDYSYDLLAAEMQRFFVALCVFRGGFTVEAAARICLPADETGGAGDRELHDQSLRMILELQGRSLLRADEAEEGAPARFRMLESFRDYCADRLDESESAELRRRHAEHYLGLGNALPAHARGAERDNRLAALQYFLERKAVHECILLLTGLQTFSFTGREAIQELARAPEAAAADPVDQLALLGMLAKSHRYASEYEESYRTCLLALRRAQELGLEAQVAIFDQEVALALAFLGRLEEGIAYSEKCLSYGRRTGNLRAVGIAQMNIGTNRWALGDFDAALEAFRETLEVAKQLGTPPDWTVYYNLARVNLDAGNLDDGLQLASESLRIAQGRDDEFGTSMCLSLFSRYHRLKGNLSAALATSHEALVKRRKAGFLYWTLNAIQAHAILLIEMGCYRDAAALLAAARSVTKLRRVVDDREYAEAVEKVKKNLPEATFEQAWAKGLGMSLDEAFALATAHR
jgi:predicted ATPase/DNA-binding SARP family transcriptional activator